MAKLYLIPNLLAETSPDEVLPAWNMDLVEKIRHFIVEDVRNARRFLRTCSKQIVIDDLLFYELNKRTTIEQKQTYLQPISAGLDVGIISEAGCPAIADPGAEIVAMAHQKEIEVVPLVGPSSIILSLMASGLNGQSFTFHGYLPIRKGEKENTLKQLEAKSKRETAAQIFIETPYRNNQMLEDIVRICHADVLLTIACNITAKEGFVKTYSVRKWRNRLPDLHKKPTVFILQWKK